MRCSAPGLKTLSTIFPAAWTIFWLPHPMLLIATTQFRLYTQAPSFQSLYRRLSLSFTVNRAINNTVEQWLCHTSLNEPALPHGAPQLYHSKFNEFLSLLSSRPPLAATVRRWDNMGSSSKNTSHSWTSRSRQVIVFLSLSTQLPKSHWVFRSHSSRLKQICRHFASLFPLEGLCRWFLAFLTTQYRYSFSWSPLAGRDIDGNPLPSKWQDGDSVLHAMRYLEFSFVLVF